MNVIIENDDSHHHPHAEQHGVCVGEPTAVLPATEALMEEKSLTRRKLLNNDQRTGGDAESWQIAVS